MRQSWLARLTIALIICAFCAASLAAQEPMIKGKVVPAESPNNPPRLWSGIRIKVKNKLTNMEVEGEQKFTLDHTWYHVVPLGARVDVLFDKGPCYVPDGLTNVAVARENPEMETVRLQKTRECLIGERRLRRQRVASAATATAATASSATVAAAGGSAAKSPAAGKISQSEPEAATQAVPKSDADLLPSPEVLKKELEKEAALARDGEFFDTFQYNFAIKGEIYSEIPALMEVLSQFRKDQRNQDLFKTIGSVTPEVFQDSARAQFELSGEVELNNIKKIIKDEGLSPNVRGSASVALLNLELDNETATEMRGYYRQQTQDASSEIFATSLVALARIGESSDYQKLYDYVLDGQNPHRLIAMEALAVAQLIEGPGPLTAGAQTLADIARKDDDPKFRAAAVYALRPFAYQQDEMAITTLISGAKDPSSKVRIEAIWALSIDEIEDQPRVRRILKFVAKRDPSAFVRRAAFLSLTGPTRLGNSLRYPE